MAQSSVGLPYPNTPYQKSQPTLDRKYLKGNGTCSNRGQASPKSLSLREPRHTQHLPCVRVEYSLSKTPYHLPQWSWESRVLASKEVHGTSSPRTEKLSCIDGLWKPLQAGALPSFSSVRPALVQNGGAVGAYSSVCMYWAHEYKQGGMRKPNKERRNYALDLKETQRGCHDFIRTPRQWRRWGREKNSAGVGLPTRMSAPQPHLCTEW